MSRKPSPARVSVVIPTYNRANLLRNAVESALDQGPFLREIIVVNDGSTDSTAEVLDAIRGPRVKVLSQDRAGPAAARNRGWRSATAEWVQFLDSDDLLAPKALQVLLDAAALSPGRIPFGQSNLSDLDVSRPVATRLAFARRSGNILKEAAFYSAGTIMSALIPRLTLERMDGFSTDPLVSLCEDYDFAIRLASENEFTYVQQVTYLARIHGDNRHSSAQIDVWKHCLASARQQLSRDYSTALLSRRVQAYFWALIAGANLQRGRVGTARRQYFRCLALWPIKVGAWQGLLRSLASRSEACGKPAKSSR